MKQAGKIHTDRVYAFIDKQTLNLVTRDHGWILDLAKFRKYLQDSYDVEKAFLLIRYFESDNALHSALKDAGYVCLFINASEKDSDYALDAILHDRTYDKAIIVSGNDEYHVLLDKLSVKGKLAKIFIPQAIPPQSFDPYREAIVRLGKLREDLEKGRAIRR
jgi:hypothetical protein